MTIVLHPDNAAPAQTAFTDPGRPVPERPLEGSFATLPEALRAAARQFGEREAYVQGDARMSFAEWDRRADAVAVGLAGSGVRPGAVLAILLPSSLPFAVYYVAAMRAGAVVTALSTRMGPAEVRAVIAASGATHVVCLDSEQRLAPDSPVVRLTPGDFERSKGEAPEIHRGRSDPAVIIWTSGTTGLPKGAWFDHAALEAAAVSAGIMSAPFDRRLVATPFSHAGYLAKVWDQIAWGMTFVIAPVPWSEKSTAEVIRAEHVTVAAAVPTQWAKLLELPEAESRFETLRIGTSATAPAPPSTARAVRERFGIPLVVRYAMTESPSICGTEPTDPPEAQWETVGRAQSGMEVAVRDASGRDVATGTVGDVVVRGACTMRGYWNDPERTADAMDADGWLTTGDLGRLTDEGFLVLTGRRGEMYIRGGYNVYPLEVERVLARLTGVDQVAVVGWPAPVIGEIGVAFLVPREPAAPPSFDEVRASVRAELADYKAPDAVIVLDALPLTPMLKVDKRALLDGLSGGRFVLPERQTAAR